MRYDLKNLWYYGVSPFAECKEEVLKRVKDDPGVEPSRSELLESLNEEQRKLLLKYDAARDVSVRIFLECAFEKGFRLGVGLLQDAMKDD